MLILSFDIGPDRYALDVSGIVEVLPLTKMRGAPGTPDYVAGMLLYRGRAVPVIDLKQLALGRSARPFMSTRIIIVDYRPGPARDLEMLGLIAERATETSRVAEDDLEPPVIEPGQAPYLGRLSLKGEKSVQLVEVNHLLTDEVREILFPGERSGG